MIDVKTVGIDSDASPLMIDARIVGNFLSKIFSS
jgi:hypothetical protein